MPRDHADQFKTPHQPHATPVPFHRRAAREPVAPMVSHDQPTDIGWKNALAFAVMLIMFLVAFMSMTSCADHAATQAQADRDWYADAHDNPN